MCIYTHTRVHTHTHTHTHTHIQGSSFWIFNFFRTERLPLDLLFMMKVK